MGRLAARTAWMSGFALWAGGFVFYSGFVLAELRRQIPDHPPGAVTREVTASLNAVGLATLFVWWLEWRRCPPRPRSGLALLWIATMLQTGLVLLRAPLGRMYDADAPGFYWWHKVYLWGATALFFAQLALLPITLARWRAADRAAA